MGSFYALCMLGLVVIVGSSEVANGQDSSDDYLKAHNAARAALALEGFSIPNILWNDSAAAAAQNYVNDHRDCKVDASGGNGGKFDYGKNIAVSSKKISGVEAVKLWVDEKPYYFHYGNTCKNGECRHYVQVVWSASLAVGCAKVGCDNGGTLVACIYQPPANGGTPY